jgi:uncharacterized membrane protein YgaE (UPF0421/DUF939 family)
MTPDRRIKWTARFAGFASHLPTRAKLVGGLAQGLMSAFAAIVAYLPTKPLGLREGFWGSLTAIAVVQNELHDTQNSARDQFAGAAVGGVVSAIIVTFAGQHIVTYAVAVVLSMLTCWAFNISSAARLAGSTATIILLVPHQGTAGWMMMTSRIAEVGWGVTVGVITVWCVNRIEKAVSKPGSSPH